MSELCLQCFLGLTETSPQEDIQEASQPEPPQVVPREVDEQQLYSGFLSDVRAQYHNNSSLLFVVGVVVVVVFVARC